MAFRQKGRTIASWLLQVLMAAAFITIGLGKFGAPFWERSFARWGYPPGFHLVVGVIELVGGILVLVPRLTSYAGLMLGTVMVGAILTHALAGDMWARPVPHLVILMLLTWLRWPSRWRRPPVTVPESTPVRS
jgi:uncharacterized membrane protein YphA (DoxX/SURF4 family)